MNTLKKYNISTLTINLIQCFFLKYKYVLSFYLRNIKHIKKFNKYSK